MREETIGIIIRSLEDCGIWYCVDKDGEQWLMENEPKLQEVKNPKFWCSRGQMIRLGKRDMDGVNWVETKEQVKRDE